MLSRYTFFGGRRASSAGEGSYVDRYSSLAAGLVLVFFGLTVFDTVATVYYIDCVHGTEFNPIAQWMLDRGRLFFVFAKGAPTLLLLLFVIMHRHFRYGRLALSLGFGFYFLLAIYHLALQVQAYMLVRDGREPL